MIRSYLEFIFESILIAHPDFKDVMSETDDKIAGDFFSLIGQDIRTNYNGLNITDSSDKIAFTSDNQYQNKLKAGKSPDDLFSDANKTSVGRIVRGILVDNGKHYSESDISKFVDKFKAAWQEYKSKKTGNDKIRVVSGDEIKYWYLEDNYSDDSMRVGTLGKSCMRHSSYSGFFNIYTENPEVCKMLILTEKDENGDEKLRARAILWQTDKGPYLDRIYWTDPSEEVLMRNWAKENMNCQLFNKEIGTNRLKVQLHSRTIDYGFYPYLDSMPYYYLVTKELTNYEPKVDNRSKLYYCQDTSGGFEVQNQTWCELIDETYPDELCCWSEYHQSYLPSALTKWSDYFDSEIYEKEAVLSMTLEDWLPKEDSVAAIIDDEGKMDWFPIGHELIESDANDGEFYLKKLMIQLDGNWHHKAGVIQVVPVKKSGIVKLKGEFNLESDWDLVSGIVEKFFELDCDREKLSFITKDEYYKGLYENVHYTEMMNSLEEKRGSEDMIVELKEANSKLKNKENFYTNNNIIIDGGGLETAIRIFREGLNIKSGDKTLFDKAFLYAEKTLRGHVQGDLLKSQIKKIFENSLLDFCKGAKYYNTTHVEFDREKLSKFREMFKLVFTEYNDEDEIDYYLSMTAACLEFFFRLLIENVNSKDFELIQSLRYFTHHPNKLPLD